MKILNMIVILSILFLNNNCSKKNYDEEKQEIYSRISHIFSIKAADRKVEFDKMINSFKESLRSLKQQDSLILDEKKLTKIRKEISILSKCINVVTFFKGAYFPPSGTYEFIQHVPHLNAFFRNQNNYPDTIVDSARVSIQKRMAKNEIAQVYESMISSKNPHKLIDSSYYVLWNSVDSLAKFTNTEMPRAFVHNRDQMILYDKVVSGLNEVESDVDSIKNILIELDKPLNIDQFKKITDKYYDLLNNFNVSDSLRLKNHYVNSDHMKKRISSLEAPVMSIKPVIDNINVILPDVNVFMKENKYEQIVQLLNKKQKIGILKKCYSIADSFLIEEQSLNIARAVQENEIETVADQLHNFCYAEFSINPYGWLDLRYKKASALIENVLNRQSNNQTNPELSFINDLQQMKEWIEFQSKNKKLSKIELNGNNLKRAQFLIDNGNVFHQGELPVPQNSKWMMLRPNKNSYSDSLIEVVLSTKKALDPVLDEDNNPTGLKMVRNGKTTKDEAYYFRNIPGFVSGPFRKASTIQLLPDYSISTIGCDEIVIKNIKLYDISEPVLISGTDTLDISIQHGDGLYIKWIGDINNDNLIDIIVEAYPHYNISVHAVLISTYINGKRKLKLVATHSISGC